MTRILLTGFMMLLLFSQCKNREISKTDEVEYTFEIQEAFIQKEVGGIQGSAVLTYLYLYYQKSANVELVKVLIQEQEILLKNHNKSARAFLMKPPKWKPDSKNNEGILFYKVGEDLHEMKLNIEVKEPLYMP